MIQKAPVSIFHRDVGASSHAVPLYFIRHVPYALISPVTVGAGAAYTKLCTGVTVRTITELLRTSFFSMLLRGEFKSFAKLPRTARQFSESVLLPTIPRHCIWTDS